MSRNVIGADRIRMLMKQLPERAKKYAAAANEKGAKELVRTAKVLIPVGGDVHGDGHERDKITVTALSDGAQLVDMGPKSKVIEGERGPRPFVNPALAVTRKRHAGRSKRAVNKAVKELFNG